MQHTKHRCTEVLDDFHPREGTCNVPMTADLKGSENSATHEGFPVESGSDKSVSRNHPNNGAKSNASKPESLNLDRLNVLKRSSSHDALMRYGEPVVRNVSFEDSGEMTLKKSSSHGSLVDYHPRPLPRKCRSSPAGGSMCNGIASTEHSFPSLFVQLYLFSCSAPFDGVHVLMQCTTLSRV